MSRTEDQITTRAPIKIALGGKEYEVALLPIAGSRQWRKDAAALLATLPQYTKIDTDDAELFGEAMNALLFDMPDKVCDLFFQWAKDLDRDAIEAVATDLEMAEAFKAVAGVAFPLVQSVQTLVEKVAQ